MALSAVAQSNWMFRVRIRPSILRASVLMTASNCSGVPATTSEPISSHFALNASLLKMPRNSAFSRAMTGWGVPAVVDMPCQA